MKLLVTFSFVFLSLLTKAQNPLPQVVSGKIERIEHFQSRFVTPRTIDIWLPEGYNSHTKYPVLYMHDGQMLYDPNLSWNKQAWDIDNVMTTLVKSGKIRNYIVVGIWNGGSTRHSDYFPQKPYASLSQTEKDTVVAQLQKAGRTKERFKPQSDNYLTFIVKELKPFIDNHYAVYKNSENTFIAGSSMGGLISMYAICEYPRVFGGAACLSTHWVGSFAVENNPVPEAFLSYLAKNLPHPKNHKIYFDCGDQTLDALYPPIQRKVDELMKIKGYDQKSWMTKYFPGENHSEAAWNKRWHIPLLFWEGQSDYLPHN